jgi:hypothetical protein
LTGYELLQSLLCLVFRLFLTSNSGLQVNSRLKGNLDYLLRNMNADERDKSFLVVEAKNDDLSRGFTQLSAELIALAIAEEQDILYGAVTVGDT